MDPAAIVLIALSLLAGGLLKGVTGAGAPIFVTPAITMFYDVKTAVVILLVPNIVTNLSQAVSNRTSVARVPHLLRFLVPAVLAAAIGSLVLSRVPAQWPTLALCLVITVYLIFRLFRPRWSMSTHATGIVAAPAGLAAGFLHGVAGLSAPVSITYFNAMGLPRSGFAGAISCFFLTAGLVQIMVLGLEGVITTELFVLSIMACVPILVGTTVGNAIARYVPERLFGTLVQLLLLALLVKLLWDLIS